MGKLIGRGRYFRLGLLMLGVLGVLLIAGIGPTAVKSLRPAIGYRSVLAAAVVQLLDPSVPPPHPYVQQFEDIVKREINFIVDYHGFRYRGNTRDLIDANMYYYGGWERPGINFMRDALTEDDVVIDVGAHTGTFTAVASKYAKEVHAIEPYPPTLVRLRTLVEENEIGNVTVHAVGLGAAAAELPFFAPADGNLGSASFVPGFVTNNAELKLKIVRGDTYLDQAGVKRVDFIKMDIEGYEKHALAGLQETLRRDRPIVLMELSINPALPDLFKSSQELQGAFPEKYQFFVFREQNAITGAYRLHLFSESFDKKAQFNLVAWPDEKAGRIPLVFAGAEG